MDCYIYGAGHLYNRIVNMLRLSNDIRIIGVITTEKPAYGTIDGFRRYSLESVDFSVSDYVIIAVENWKEIFSILKKRGLSNESIILGKVFTLPYFDFIEYIKMKKGHPSIISNSCLGGRVCKELGIEMLTPTINAACFDDNNYIEFIDNIKNYVSEDIIPYENNRNDICRGTYNREFFIPKGILNSKIVWSFPHDDISYAVSNWNRRRERVNFDNMSFIMIAFSDEGAISFDALNLERKVCFYYKNLGLKSVIYTPEWNEVEIKRKYDYNYPMFVHRYATNIEGLGRVNWLNFLNGNENILRW